jgi:hypothetical protein
VRLYVLRGGGKSSFLVAPIVLQRDGGDGPTAPSSGVRLRIVLLDGLPPCCGVFVQFLRRPMKKKGHRWRENIVKVFVGPLSYSN